MPESQRPTILVLPGATGEPPSAELAVLSPCCRLAFAAGTADAAASLSGPTAPDLVLADVSAPALQDPAVRRRLAEHADDDGSPLLLLVRPGDEDRLAELPLEPYDLLYLPTPPAGLAARVRSLLRNRRICGQITAELEALVQVGIALSVEHNRNRLLERIVREARALNHAEAATLYTVDHAAGLLHFQIMQNERLGIYQGGESGDRMELPAVPLSRDNVSGYVALTGEVINIPDVYAAEGFDFSGPRRYDALTGYRSRSMLVVPLTNHEGEVIGVLQLINARTHPDGEVTPFQGRRVERSRALASQAGIALTNAHLINDLQAFLEGLIQVMASAIDQKSAYTSGHVRRVTRLAMLLAEAVNECPEGALAHRRFSAEELEELRIAGLLHDIGKIVVPEHVVDKATKLQTVYDRMEEIRTRFSVIRRGMENAALRAEVALLMEGNRAAADLAREMLAADLAALADDLAFIESANRGGEFMAEERLARLQAIAARRYEDDDGAPRPYLTEDEVRNLSIARGTLLPEELQIIRGHARVSLQLLQQIPFSRKLRNVPVIAGDHHETLNGTGYPTGKTAPELPLQSRILAIADICDALTAADRPYKKAYSQEVAYRILREEAERGKLDAELVELFIRADCHRRLQEELENEAE